MKYSIKLIDNFNMLNDLKNIRTWISNEFEPTQELDSEISIIDSLNKRNIEELLAFLTSKITEDEVRTEKI